MSRLDKYIVESFNKCRRNDFKSNEDVHERSFVFRFAHYLANFIENDNYYKDYKVDVEYNRKEIKNIKVLNNKRIIPDLIVHKRGIKDNLLAMEFKNKNDSFKDKTRLIELHQNNSFSFNYIYFCIIEKNKIEKYENKTGKIIGDTYD